MRTRHHSPCVVLVQGFNPGPFTLDGTNTWIVGSGSRKILIDTGQGLEAYQQALRDTLASHSATLDSILITHGHQDHIGGLLSVMNLCKEFQSTPPKVYKRSSVHDEYPFVLPIQAHQRFQVPGATLEAIYTPGHTKDHVSFRFVEENDLFSGDCILGKGSTVFDDLHDYMQSLEVLKALNLRRIYPGHGPIIMNAPEKIDEYISHRQERENQILQVLKNESQSSLESIVAHLYRGYPKEVHEAAKGSTRLHLLKLEQEQRVYYNTMTGSYHLPQDEKANVHANQIHFQE